MANDLQEFRRDIYMLDHIYGRASDSTQPSDLHRAAAIRGGILHPPEDRRSWTLEPTPSNTPPAGGGRGGMSGLACGSGGTFPPVQDLRGRQGTGWSRGHGGGL